MARITKASLVDQISLPGGAGGFVAVQLLLHGVQHLVQVTVFHGQLHRRLLEGEGQLVDLPDVVLVQGQHPGTHVVLVDPRDMEGWPFWCSMSWSNVLKTMAELPFCVVIQGGGGQGARPGQGRRHEPLHRL